jgi:hypothetical protein
MFGLFVVRCGRCGACPGIHSCCRELSARTTLTRTSSSQHVTRSLSAQVHQPLFQWPHRLPSRPLMTR